MIEITMGEKKERNYTRLTFPEGGPEHKQLSVMLEALVVYSAREQKYHGNWQRRGWRGALYELRHVADRAWNRWWAAPPERVDVTAFGEETTYLPSEDVDDLLDAMNFAAMAVRTIREGNRGDEWWSHGGG